MKDRILIIVALLIFAMMLHPQRREEKASSPGRWRRFVRFRQPDAQIVGPPPGRPNNPTRIPAVLPSPAVGFTLSSMMTKRTP